jgi:hypothetical protein
VAEKNAMPDRVGRGRPRAEAWGGGLMSTEDVTRIWHDVTELVKKRLVLPALWRAMEEAKAIAVDDGLLVLGFPARSAHGAGLLLDSKNTNVIEQAVQEVSGQPLRLKVIQGETLQEWQEQKQRDAEAAAFARTMQEKRRRETDVEQSWDGVSERLTRRYAELPLRGLAQTQAAYLDEALDVLHEALGRLMSDPPTELEQRGLARVIDKVADRSGVPAPVIAYFLRERSR